MVELPNLVEIARCCCPESCPGLWIRSPKDLGQPGSGFSRVRRRRRRGRRRRRRRSPKDLGQPGSGFSWVRRRIGGMNNLLPTNNFPPTILKRSSGVQLIRIFPVEMFLAFCEEKISIQSLRLCELAIH